MFKRTKRLNMDDRTDNDYCIALANSNCNFKFDCLSWEQLRELYLNNPVK